MKTERQKLSVAFWASVVVVGLVLYVASFGPVCWLTSRAGIRSRSLAVIYSPLTRFIAIDTAASEKSLRKVAGARGISGISSIALYAEPVDLISRYASLYAAETWRWRFIADVEQSPEFTVRMDRGYWEWCDSTKR